MFEEVHEHPYFLIITPIILRYEKAWLFNDFVIITLLKNSFLYNFASRYMFLLHKITSKCAWIRYNHYMIAYNFYIFEDANTYPLLQLI